MKSRKRFRILCIGLFVATVGSGLSAFGLGVYVFGLHGSVTEKALISFLAFLPGLLLTPFAGVLADRYDRRLLMIAGDGLSATGLLYILFKMRTGTAGFFDIGLGVTISSVFSSLTTPAFQATLSDLLDESYYTRAGGIVGAIESSRFLLAPVLAGVLLKHAGIRWILRIDVLTLVVTVLTTETVRRGMENEETPGVRNSVKKDFKEGLSALTENRGVLRLTETAFLLCFFIGIVQELITPLILSFQSPEALGRTVSICASGMLFSSLFLSKVPLEDHFQKILAGSLFLAGLFMIGIGWRENLATITVFGFLFFFMLPFANTSMDYLVRTSVDNRVQGRIWSMIGVISQSGYVLCYLLIGPLGDRVFSPLLQTGGRLEESVGKVIGTGPGRGLALLMMLGGLLLSLVSGALYRDENIGTTEVSR